LQLNLSGKFVLALFGAEEAGKTKQNLQSQLEKCILTRSKNLKSNTRKRIAERMEEQSTGQ
jgi:hypothetical protein